MGFTPLGVGYEPQQRANLRIAHFLAVEDSLQLAAGFFNNLAPIPTMPSWIGMVQKYEEQDLLERTIPSFHRSNISNVSRAREGLSMDVSIVIRTQNEAEFIDKTLANVEEQSFSGSYEVIIVDSGSTDSTLDIIKNYNVRIIQIRQDEFTYGRSLNVGASKARGAFIVNLSAHALPRDKEWLTNLVSGFENPDVAGVYGRQLCIGRLNPFEAMRNERFFGQERITFSTKNKRMLRQVHFSNSNSAVRRKVWEVFKFDEHVPYAEDILWQREVVEAGFSIAYASDAAVYHTHRVSIYNTYKYSRDCAYTLALMKRKRQSILLAICDIGIFLASVPNSVLDNLRYVLQNGYIEYVSIVPFYVTCGWFGWLMGRIKYRLKKW